ncbi:hypothetical protein ACJX0J_015645, partial [Zea mays]
LHQYHLQNIMKADSEIVAKIILNMNGLEIPIIFRLDTTKNKTIFEYHPNHKKATNYDSADIYQGLLSNSKQYYFVKDCLALNVRQYPIYIPTLFTSLSLIHARLIPVALDLFIF